MDCSPPRLLCPWDFPRQEYWSGLPFPPPGDLLDPGIETSSPASPAMAGRFFTTEPPGKSTGPPGKFWNPCLKEIFFCWLFENFWSQPTASVDICVVASLRMIHSKGNWIWFLDFLVKNTPSWNFSSLPPFFFLTSWFSCRPVYLDLGCHLNPLLPSLWRQTIHTQCFTWEVL